MQMEEGLDTGAYCASRVVPRGHRSASELTEELAALGAQALIEVLENPVSYTHLVVINASERDQGGNVPKTWNLGFAPGRRRLVTHLSSLEMCIRDRACTVAMPT